MTKGKDSNFILNAERKGEPVELFEERSDVNALALYNFKHKASSTFLDTLKMGQLVREIPERVELQKSTV